MKRYLVFMGRHYYPGGGMDDFVGSFNTIKECRKAITEKMKEEYYEHIHDSLLSHYRYQYENSWFHMVYSKTGEVIYRKD